MAFQQNISVVEFEFHLLQAEGKSKQIPHPEKIGIRNDGFSQISRFYAARHFERSEKSVYSGKFHFLIFAIYLQCHAMKTFYVYILGSETGTLYTGITNNMKRRVMEHKEGIVPGFTKTYHVDKLLYLETFQTATAAVAREKQIKSYRREKKIKLIDAKNPQWLDLTVMLLG